MNENKQRLKWSNLDVGGPYTPRYRHEILSRYNFLKHQIEQYTKPGMVMPPALHVLMPEYKTLEASLRRLNLIK